MANVKFFDLLADSRQFDDLFHADRIELQDGATDQRAVYIDSDSGNKIVVEGNNLDYTEMAISSGSVTRITFTDADDGKFVGFSKAKADGATFYDAYLTGGSTGMFNYLLRGNDKISGATVNDYLDGVGGRDLIHGGKGDDCIFSSAKGSTLFGDKGDDIMFSIQGKDRMTGGKGSDTFSFYGETGKDVVTDFDATGGGHRQDYLRIYTDKTFTLHKSGHDMLLKFDDGDLIRLLHVSAKQFDEHDIVFF